MGKLVPDSQLSTFNHQLNLMAYDPNLPADNSLASAAELRNQLAGLKALIDAQQATIDSQQATINDNSVQIGDMLNTLNTYIASHP
jgi:hypothetical protein